MLRKRDNFSSRKHTRFSICRRSKVGYSIYQKAVGEIATRRKAKTGKKLIMGEELTIDKLREIKKKLKEIDRKVPRVYIKGIEYIVLKGKARS